MSLSANVIMVMCVLYGIVCFPSPRRRARDAASALDDAARSRHKPLRRVFSQGDEYNRGPFTFVPDNRSSIDNQRHRIIII